MGKFRKDPRNVIRDELRNELAMFRGTESYIKVKDSLCIVSKHVSEYTSEDHVYVTRTVRSVRIMLCRLIIQGEERFTEPIRKSEAAEWNRDIREIIKSAGENTFAMFPATVTDLKYRRTAIIPKPLAQDYDFRPAAVSMAAESSGYRETAGAGADLRFIVNADPIVGDSLLIYPFLMKYIGCRTERDPVILACAPGKLYVFDTAKKKESFDRYLERYMKRVGENSYTPRLYKYFRSSNSLGDTFTETFISRDICKETHIPPWSVISAWGDACERSEMFEWRRRINAGNDKKED